MDPGTLLDLNKSTRSQLGASCPFAFDMPLSFFEKADAEAGKQRRIGGVMSSEARDRQGEIILQRGLEFEDFLANGWFNDNHTKDTDGILGYPESVQSYQRGQVLPDGRTADTNCTWVEGYILTDYPRADRIWDLGQALQSTGRRLGFSVEGAITQRRGPGDSIIAKAKVRNCAITNCFPGDVRVVGKAVGISRRWYEGAMVEVVLASGQRLTGTPNHPVFTQRGWVALGRLNEAHDRVGCHRAYLDGGVSRLTQHVQDVPPTLEQCFAASEVVGAAKHHRISEADFHGDGQDGEVQVVASTGNLATDIRKSFIQQYGKLVLPASDFEHRSFSLSRALGSLGLRVAVATESLIRSLRPFGALLRGDFALPPVHLLGAATGYAGGARLAVHQHAADSKFGGQIARVFAGGVAAHHGGYRLSGELGALRNDFPRPLGDSDHGGPADAVEGRDAGRALSPSIAFGDIKSVRFFNYSGHVYNLESSDGWFDANGFTVHNCPVNTDARLEILARSLQAIEDAGAASDEVVRAMTVGAAVSGSPVTGAGAGAVLSRKDLERKLRANGVQKARGRVRKSLTDAEAAAWARRHVPGLGGQAARDFVRLTHTLHRCGIL